MRQQSTLFQKFFSLTLGMIFILGLAASSANCRSFELFEKALASPYGVSLLDCHTAPPVPGSEDEDDNAPDFCSFCKISQGFASQITPEITFLASQSYEISTYSASQIAIVEPSRNSGRAPPLS